MRGVHQQSCSQSSPLEAVVNREASDAHRGQSGVAGKALSLFLWQINNRDARRRKRVVGGNGAGRCFDRDKAVGYVPADILGSLSLKIPVQNLFPTTKQGVIMRRGERLDTKRESRHSAPNRSRYRRKALRRAGTGSGGLRIASAICRWSSTERRTISVCSMVRHAASSAAATTKSVSVRPWISAARFNRAITSFGKRASRRACGRDSCLILIIYGSLPYKSNTALVHLSSQVC